MDKETEKRIEALEAQVAALKEQQQRMMNNVNAVSRLDLDELRRNQSDGTILDGLIG